MRGGILLRAIGDFADENARAGFGDAEDLAQAGGNVFARDDEENVVANDDRGAGVGQGQRVGEGLADVEAGAADEGDFFFGGEQAEGAVDAESLGHAEEGAVAAADVDEVVIGSELDGFDDLFVNAAGEVFFVAAAEGEVVEIAGVAGGLAAVFDVVVGAGDHRVERL